jgi:hypothetical protein
MSVSANSELESLAQLVVGVEERIKNLTYERRVLLMAFIKEARAAGKSFVWVGERLNLTDNAIRLFETRNKHLLGPKDFAAFGEKHSLIAARAAPDIG